MRPISLLLILLNTHWNETSQFFPALSLPQVNPFYLKHWWNYRNKHVHPICFTLVSSVNFMQHVLHLNHRRHLFSPPLLTKCYNDVLSLYYHYSIFFIYFLIGSITEVEKVISSRGHNFHVICTANSTDSPRVAFE